MSFQEMFDAIAHAGLRERSKYHLTYGGLIDACTQAPPGTRLAGEYAGISSYRGYYEDIAICTEMAQLSFPGITCDTLASWLQKQLGETLWGYKGGDYVINRDKPLWIAQWSGDCSNLAVVSAVFADGYLVLQTKEV